MLTVKDFEERLSKIGHPDWLHVGVDSKDENQLYIIVNGGIANINCSPIEIYPAEIKNCALEMIFQEELFLKPNEKPLRIEEGRSVFTYTFKLVENYLHENSAPRKPYFSSFFIRWQRTHQLSNEESRKKLGLTAEEFQLFREDELMITFRLIDKLAEVTGASTQFWKYRWLQKDRNQRWKVENI